MNTLHFRTFCSEDAENSTTISALALPHVSWFSGILLTLLVILFSSAASGDDYYVVVGSFLDSDTAVQELSRRSDRSGTTLRIAIIEIENQTWHRLISGPFMTATTAYTEQTSWQQVGVIDAWIVRLDVPERRKKSLRLALTE